VAVNEKQLTALIEDIIASYAISKKHLLANPVCLPAPTNTNIVLQEKPTWYEGLTLTQRKSVLSLLSNDNIADDGHWVYTRAKLCKIEEHCLTTFTNPITAADADELRTYLMKEYSNSKTEADHEWQNHVPLCADKAARAKLSITMVAEGNSWILAKMLKDAEGHMPTTTSDFKMAEEDWTVTLEALIYAHMVCFLYILFLFTFFLCYIECTNFSLLCSAQ
jgi:hypothetical protein